MRKHNWLILTCLLVCLALPGKVLSGAPDMKSLVPAESPDGWNLRGTPELFTKENLFEHIDGQADLFLQYGFQGSIFAIYQSKNSAQEKIDLDIYDMGGPVQAYGIFSRFRQEGHSAGIGLASYLEDNYGLFYKGKYFVVIQGSGSSSPKLKQLAKMIESRISDNSPRPKEIGYFPESGLKPDSIEYYPQGLMGRQFFKRGFKGTYEVPREKKPGKESSAGGPDSTLFLAIFDNPEEAASALKMFKEDVSKRSGARAQSDTQTGFDAVKGADAYQGEVIIVQKGRYLAGAAGFEQEKEADKLLGELVKRVR
jgi:hypothetical protein